MSQTPEHNAREAIRPAAERTERNDRAAPRRNGPALDAKTAEAMEALFAAAPQYRNAASNPDAYAQLVETVKKATQLIEAGREPTESGTISKYSRALYRGLKNSLLTTVGVAGATFAINYGAHHAKLRTWVGTEPDEPTATATRAMAQRQYLHDHPGANQADISRAGDDAVKTLSRDPVENAASKAGVIGMFSLGVGGLTGMIGQVSAIEQEDKVLSHIVTSIRAGRQRRANGRRSNAPERDEPEIEVPNVPRGGALARGNGNQHTATT